MNLGLDQLWQVPMKIAIVGLGKLGTHLSHFLKLSDIEHTCFERKSNKSLLKNFDVILLSINDDDIESFYLKHQISEQIWIHFSGVFYHEKIIGLHPMMSFSNKLYELDFYQKIAWKIDHKILIDQYLPILKEQVSFINPKDKAYYHALCVMAGNLPHLICLKIHQELNQLGLKEEEIKRYIKVSFDNYLNDLAPTGPIVRDDQLTIKKNIASLGSNYQKIYQAVRDVYHE